MTDRDDSKKFPELGNQCSRCHWGLVQGSGVGGCTAVQAAGLIELPCVIPRKGAKTGGGVVVSGIAVLFELLSAIDVDGMEFDGRWRMKVL